MAPPQTIRNNQDVGGQCKAERAQLPSYKGADLQEKIISIDTNAEFEHSVSSPTSNTQRRKSAHPEDRKRKRSSEYEAGPHPTSPTDQKRSRTSPPQSPIEAAVDEKIARPLENWTKEFHWPREYFEAESNMDQQRLARQRSSASLSAAGCSTASSATPSDQKPREEKSTPHKSPQYETLLATRGSFMRKSKLGISDTSKTTCRTLLEAEQSVPNDTLFADDCFEETCEEIHNQNEAKVIQDISRLIVPSAHFLAIRGDKKLKILVESVNAGWNNSIPLTKPRPQPDYAVGFRRDAFTAEQLEKLRPFVGGLSEASYFMGTWYMYFPFFTCEVKCGTSGLDIADRQNAHSVTLAVRGIVELFRLAKREEELHREILAFSISHDDSSVRIYGHYPVIDGPETTFYRHKIRTFDFTDLDGKEKWTAYKFTKNLYDTWMPTHFERICSAIDSLPSDVNFDVSLHSESGESENSPTSESHSVPDPPSPDTSLSQGIEEGREFKKPRKRGPSDINW